MGLLQNSTRFFLKKTFLEFLQGFSMSSSYRNFSSKDAIPGEVFRNFLRDSFRNCPKVKNTDFFLENSEIITSFRYDSIYSGIFIGHYLRIPLEVFQGISPIVSPGSPPGITLGLLSRILLYICPRIRSPIFA